MAESCKLGSLENSAMFNLQDDFFFLTEKQAHAICVGSLLSIICGPSGFAIKLKNYLHLVLSKSGLLLLNHTVMSL